jgi:hypothetical protein
MRRPLRIVASLVPAIAVWLPMAGAQRSAPVLTVEGDHFLVDGAPRFLRFISYFDAMRRSDAGGRNRGDLDTDFAYLRARGFDGIRIFPNWQHYCAGTPSDDGLFGEGESLRTGRIPVFLRVLDRAAAHELLVDATFTPIGRTTSGEYETTPSEYKHQFEQLARRLEGAYPHVFFDLANEYDDHSNLDEPDVAAIAAAVHAIDPARLVTVSTGSGSGDQTLAGEVARSARLDFAAVHPGRSADWWRDGIADAIARARAGMGVPLKPVYVQEPIAAASTPCYSGQGTDADVAHQLAAVRTAKAQGAAAFTLHTRTTFDLAARSYTGQLKANERAAVEGLADAAGAVAWGAGAAAPPPTSGPTAR